MVPPKAPKKASAKKATALVTFERIGDAFAAIMASERAEKGMAGIQITWAGGAEPAVIAHLKGQGKLGARSGKSPTQTAAAAPSGATPVGAAFSSFPETLVRLFIHPGGNCIDVDLIFLSYPILPMYQINQLKISAD